MREMYGIWEDCHMGLIDNWQYQSRIKIDDGEPYYGDSIFSTSYEKGLIHDAFSVGNCIASKLTVIMLPRLAQVIQVKSKITYEIRVTSTNDGESPWATFGDYYVDTASNEDGKWTITAYDKMNKLEIPYTENIYNGITWPATSQIVVDNIANILGIEVDQRSILDDNILVKKPDKITARQALGYIGGLHAGNWTITENNKLRLIVPEIKSIHLMTPIIARSNSKKIVREEPVTINKLIVKYGGNDNETITKGSGSTELLYSNPWATEYSVNKMYNILSNFTYYPFTVTSTNFDPSFELGDTIQIHDKSVNLWQISYSSRMMANLDFPANKANKKADGVILVNSGGGGNYDKEIADLKLRAEILEMLRNL